MLWPFFFVITYQLGINPLITTIWSLWYCGTEELYLCFMCPSQENDKHMCFEVEIGLRSI